MCNINHHKNAYKANMLLLLLSSLVTRKILQHSIGVATEQSIRYIELTDAKIWISKMRQYVGFWQIGSHIILVMQILSINIYNSLTYIMTSTDN